MDFIIILFFLVTLLYLLILFFFIKELIYALFIFKGAPFVPCPEDQIIKILDLLELKPGEILYDLGSGDGRVIIEAANSYGVKAIGIEINPLLVFSSRRRIIKLGLEGKVEVLWGNFFKKNLSGANAITVYLTQPANNRLERKFLSELRPKTRVVSKSFTFKNLPFIKSDLENPNLRLYQIPSDKNR